jgi:hypothetical protein
MEGAAHLELGHRSILLSRVTEAVFSIWHGALAVSIHQRDGERQQGDADFPSPLCRLERAHAARRYTENSSRYRGVRQVQPHRSFVGPFYQAAQTAPSSHVGLRRNFFWEREISWRPYHGAARSGDEPRRIHHEAIRRAQATGSVPAAAPARSLLAWSARATWKVATPSCVTMVNRTYSKLLRSLVAAGTEELVAGLGQIANVLPRGGHARLSFVNALITNRTAMTLAPWHELSPQVFNPFDRLS